MLAGMRSRWVLAMLFGSLAAIASFSAVVAGLSRLTLAAQLGWGLLAALAAGLLTFLQTFGQGVGSIRIPPPLPDEDLRIEVPATPRVFVDRRSQIARALLILRHRTGAPVLVVTGLSGVGKTTFALVVAKLLGRNDYHDLVFVRLHTTDQPAKSADEVVASTLVALGVSREAFDLSAERRQARLTDELRRRRALVVFDGAASAEQLAGVRLADGNAAIVTTDHELPRLLRTEAKQLRLQPLTIPQSLWLLARRIGMLRVASQPRGALRLVRSCGGLPGLLAAVAGDLSQEGNKHERLSEAASQIVDRLPSLDEEISRALTVSYQRLSIPQRRVVQLIGVLDATELDAVVVAAALPKIDATQWSGEQPSPEQTIKLLRDLVNAGLLENGPSAQRWYPHDLRWYPHDLVRCFAREQARELDDADRSAAVASAAAIYLDRVKSLRDLKISEAARLYPELAAMAQAAIDREWARGTAAVDWAARCGLDLVGAISDDVVDLLFEFADWRGVPSPGIAVGALHQISRISRRHAAPDLERRSAKWFEQHPEHRRYHPAAGLEPLEGANQGPRRSDPRPVRPRRWSRRSLRARSQRPARNSEPWEEISIDSGAGTQGWRITGYARRAPYTRVAVVADGRIVDYVYTNWRGVANIDIIVWQSDPPHVELD
jgi:hypothetical protein